MQARLSNALGWATTILWILGILAVLLYLVGAPVDVALRGLIDGAFGGRNFAFLASTMSFATLIVGMGISVTLAFRAGLFNAGGEGQLVAGGIASAIGAIVCPGPPLFVLVVAVVCGIGAGAAWATLAGLLELWFGVPLLVSSLLLNFPIRYAGSYLVGHPLRDVPSGMMQTVMVPAGTWLPLLPGLRVDMGIVVVAVVTVLVLLYSRYTVHGYQTRLNGISTQFARAAGFPVRRLSMESLALSGGVAGLVGTLAVLGVFHRYIDGMLVQPLYAWTGLVSVLLVGVRPALVPIAGFFFAALETGALGMQRSAGVPKELAFIMQAVIILFLAGRVSKSLRAGAEHRSRNA